MGVFDERSGEQAYRLKTPQKVSISIAIETKNRLPLSKRKKESDIQSLSF